MDVQVQPVDERARLGVSVTKIDRPDEAYAASAFLITSRGRIGLVNGRGDRLIAFGRTPRAATTHLLSALKRRGVQTR